MAKEMLRAIQDFPTWSQQQHSSEYIAYTGDGKSKATAQLGLDFVDDYNEKQKLPRFKKKKTVLSLLCGAPCSFGTDEYDRGVKTKKNSVAPIGPCFKLFAALLF